MQEINACGLQEIFDNYNLFSNQAELYDQINCFLIFLVLLIISVIVVTAIKLIVHSDAGLTQKNKDIKSLIISLLFCSVSALQTLFIYIFAINCRKVAIFRGYLRYMENLMSDSLKINVLKFNSDVVEEFYKTFDLNHLPKTFFSNILGPIALSVFVFIVFVGCIYLTFKYLNKISYVKNFGIAHILLILYFVFCVLFVTVCVFDLCLNGTTINMVEEFCWGQ